MDLIKGELEKEFRTIGFRNQRKNLKTLPQTQKRNVDIERDSQLNALMPGKRISKTGKVYWETRRNRSDTKNSKI